MYQLLAMGVSLMLTALASVCAVGIVRLIVFSQADQTDVTCTCSRPLAMFLLLLTIPNLRELCGRFNLDGSRTIYGCRWSLHPQSTPSNRLVFWYTICRQGQEIHFQRRFRIFLQQKQKRRR